MTDFAVFASTTSALLGLSLWLYARSAPSAFRPSRLTVIAALAILLVIFSLGTVPRAPVSIVILPLLVGLVLVALARNRQREGQQVALRILSQEHLSPRSLLPLALAPLAATLVYAAAVALDLRWQTNWLVYLVKAEGGSAPAGARGGP